SPDGKLIVFSAASYSVEENKGNSDLYLINADGSNMRLLKDSEKNESNPKFVKSLNKISYIMDGQIWLCNYDGSDEEKITDIYTKVSDYEWSPDGSEILITSSVYKECDSQECNEEKDKQKEASKVKASIFTELMYRHWDSWREGKVSQLFLFDVKEKSMVDVTPETQFDIPPISLGSANDFSFSPDGNEIAFVMNTDKFISTSTNNDVFITDGDGRIEKISLSEGNDNQPVYSPDGKYIAFASMKRAGFEADKQNLILYNREDGSYKSLTEDFDLSVNEIIWSGDSKEIYFTAANEINNSIFKVSIEDGEPELFHLNNVNTKIKLSPDGKTLFFLKQRSDLPNEIFSISTDGKNTLKQITFINKDILAELEFNPVETFTCKGASGTEVQSILVKPPFFEADKKYPMIFLIHGGPQGYWSDDFHYR